MANNKKKYEIIICGLNTQPSSAQFKKHSVSSSNPCDIVKKWKCYTKDNRLASMLATWGLGPHSSSSPFTPGLQSSPPRKGNWSTLRFGNSYLEFGSWNWPANPGISIAFCLFVPCSPFPSDPWESGLATWCYEEITSRLLSQGFRSLFSGCWNFLPSANWPIPNTSVLFWERERVPSPQRPPKQVILAFIQLLPPCIYQS